MNIYFRKKARQCIVQALYSWQLSNNKILDIKKYFYKKNKKNMDIKYFNEIFIGVVKNKKKIDLLIQPYILKNLNRIREIEKSILRMSFYELIKKIDIPYKVIINEGIEISKIFGSKDSHKFINGILDKAAYTIRTKNFK
ncbi:transcription antitermination factor NusB [Buchnera aphidicola]|uniref:transcription antitermination factor NusB n=1 Tax=Buchnera aphidicola TaxID=9 RepID=UPI0031B84D17